MNENEYNRKEQQRAHYNKLAAEVFFREKACGGVSRVDTQHKVWGNRQRVADYGENFVKGFREFHYVFPFLSVKNGL